MDEQLPPQPVVEAKEVIIDKPKSNKFLVILLSVLLLISLIVTSFSVYQTQKLVKEITKLQPTPITSIEPQPTTDSTADWKTYTISTEKLTIEYPNDWSITVVEDQFRTVLASPNNFILIFTTNMDGLGGNCDSECQKYNIINVVLDTLSFYKVPLYVVVHGTKEDSTFGKAHIGFSVIPQKTCWDNICYGFAGKNSLGTVGINGGYYNESNDSSVYMSVDEFVESKDVKIALSILQKLSY